MNDLSTQEQANIAHNHYQQLLGLLRKQGIIFLDVGRLLKILRDESYYEVLGHSSFSEFIASGEIGVKHSTVYAYIAIYEIFVMRYGFKYEELAGIPWDKLWLSIPAVRKMSDRQSVEEVVEQARVLPRTDLIIALGGEKKEGDIQSKTVKLFKHKKCGKWIVELSADVICQC